MYTSDGLENFGIRQLPLIVSRVPGAAGQGLVDVTIAVEQFKKLPDADLPPLREVIFAIKASNLSRRTRRLQARLNVSGNDGLPFLIWDVLTYPDRSSILKPHRENFEKTRRQLNNGPQGSNEDIAASDVFCYQSLFAFLGSEAPKYPPDMHWLYLPSATSHYIRCVEIDQYFGTRNGSADDLRGGRRNCAGSARATPSPMNS